MRASGTALFRLCLDGLLLLGRSGSAAGRSPIRVDRSDQTIHMGMKVASDIHFGGIPVSQIRERGREPIGSGHSGPADEHGYDRDFLPEGGFEFDSHEI